MRTILLGLLLIIACSACKKEKECGNTAERTFSFSNFKAVRASGVFAFTIQQGAAFSVKANGCEGDLNDLRFSIDNGGTLIADYSRHQQDRQRVHFNITLPWLSRLVVDGATTATLTGFNQQGADLRLVLNGATECTVSGLPSLIKADLSGASKLTVTGTATDLIATLSGTSSMDAYGASFLDADVSTSGAAKLKVAVQNSLFAQASGDSRVCYKGNPTANIEQSGNGRVIHE